MARQYRAPSAGGFYHVTNRGNNKQDIFLNRGDGLFFMKYLAKACHDANIFIHAYCLMRNHYHLLVETPEANLSYAIALLQAPYARHFNKKYQRVGHVFQGPFRSQVIEVDEYYLTVVRYIMQNPIRANITDDLGAYEFCSFRMSLGWARAEPWFAHEYLMAKFDMYGATNGVDGKSEFLRFVRERDYVNLWEQVVADAYIGTPAFIEKMKPPTVRKNAIKAQARPRTRSLQEIRVKFPNRVEFIREAYYEGGYMQSEIACFLQLSPATISRGLAAINALRLQVTDDAVEVSRDCEEVALE